MVTGWFSFGDDLGLFRSIVSVHARVPSRRSRESPQPSKVAYLVTIRDPSSHRHLVLDGMSDEAASRACAAAGQGQRQRARRDGRGAPGPPPDGRPRRAPHGICFWSCSLRAGLSTRAHVCTLLHTHPYTHTTHNVRTYTQRTHTPSFTHTTYLSLIHI